uniref:Uncharacterized protein n=1 Tax=Oryza nivara TaxID=4536 RepID=A0A0E0IB87_ORYNI
MDEHTDSRHQISSSSCQMVDALLQPSLLSRASMRMTDSWRSTCRSIKRLLLLTCCSFHEKAESTSIMIPNLHVPVLWSRPVIVARFENPQATLS